MQYNFNWNPEKASNNLRKHQISFDRATSIFRDPRAISIIDEEHSESEERWLTMGLDDSGILLVVSHTFKMVDTSTCEIRIISARKADKSEIKPY
jgi:uncharacterized DUF497 family protein